MYLDHARDIGAYNPCFPDYDLVVDGERASGTVTFPIAYEGPPGVVHGGFLALFFDCAVQHHNCDVGVTGKTISMTLRYRDRRRSCALCRSRSSGRRRSDPILGALSVRDKVICQTEVDAIAGVRDNLPEVSPRRAVTT